MANKAQQAAVTNLNNAANVPVKSGQNKFGLDQDGFIWGSGISAEEYSELLSYLYPQYLATAMIDKLSSEAVSSQRFFWAEQKRTRKALEVSTIASGSGTATITITLTAGYVDYVLVGDTYRLKTGQVVVVDSVDVGQNQITVSTLDDSTITLNTELAANDKLGHIGSNFAEGSSGVGNRTTLPTQRSNQTNILRKNCVVSGTALAVRTYINDSAWFYTDQETQTAEFAVDRENALMFNQASPDGASIVSGDGIIPSLIKEGTNDIYYSGALTEADIQSFITTLKKEAPAKEFHVFAGADYMGDMQAALRDYTQGGSFNIGSGSFEASGVAAGIDFTEYMFQGTRVKFFHYSRFDDLETLPNTVAADGEFDFSNFALWLDMTPEIATGKRKISTKYLALGDENRKMKVKTINGMTGSDAYASNDTDGLTVAMLSEIGVEVRNTNHHGFHAKNA
jgi:hypothetical protein